MKPKIAIVRGKFLNLYDMQSFEQLAPKYNIRAFGSLQPIHSNFVFPVTRLVSPLDILEFPLKRQLLNRLLIDAHYLVGLEKSIDGFDIAHTSETYFHFTKQCILARKKGFVKKVVVTVSENIPFNNEGIRGRKELKQFVIREADFFIAMSEGAKAALLLEGVPDKKITIIHHGIDTLRFAPKKISTKKTNTIQLLFVGRLVRTKGVYELLYAIKFLQMDQGLKDYTLMVTMIGSGEEKEKLVEMARRLGLTDTIVYKEVNYVAMPQAYQVADIFVAPSKEDRYWQEQWGMALMEAQASGLPIITTKSGSIPENVGDAALLVQPGDVVSLADAIKRFILDPQLRREYGKRARKRAITVHDLAIIAGKIAKVYEKVLSSPSP